MHTMETRRAVALGLAIASLALAVAFMAISSTWDLVQTTSSGEDRVVPFHPWAPIWIAFGGLGLAALWWRLAWPAIVLGAIGLVMGFIAGFSAGFFGLGAGALLLAAGMVGRGAKAQPADQPAK